MATQRRKRGKWQALQPATPPLPHPYLPTTRHGCFQCNFRCLPAAKLSALPRVLCNFTGVTICQKWLLKDKWWACCFLDQPWSSLLEALSRVFCARVQATPECGSEKCSCPLALCPSPVSRSMHLSSIAPQTTKCLEEASCEIKVVPPAWLGLLPMCWGICMVAVNTSILTRGSGKLSVSLLNHLPQTQPFSPSYQHGSFI